MLDKMQLKIFIIIIDLISDGCTLHHLLFPYIRFLFPPSWKPDCVTLWWRDTPFSIFISQIKPVIFTIEFTVWVFYWVFEECTLF